VRPSRSILRWAVTTTAATGLWLAGPRPAPAADLLEEAEARRRAAEERLEATRRKLDARRRERLEALDAALSRRAEAEAKADALVAEKEALERQMARPGESPEARRRRLDSLEARLEGLAGARDDEGLEAALAATLDARLSALRRNTRITHDREPVVSRSGVEVEAPVLRVGDVMAVAGGEGSDAVGFLDLEVDGTPRVRGLEVGGDSADAFRAAARGDLGRVPLDVDGSLARATGPMRRSFVERLEAGGFFIWPIVFIGLLGLALTGERTWFLAKERVPPARAARVLRAVREGRVGAVQAALTGASALERVAAAGLKMMGRSASDRDAALETALLEEEPRLQRSIALIAACAAIAPLLGLLGTVTGMISTFEVITVHGTGNPKLLSGGISIALVTTQFGLIVAVPLLLAHAVLNRIVQRRGARLEALRSAFLESGEPAPDEIEGLEGGAPRSTASDDAGDRAGAHAVTASGGGRA